MESVYSAVRNDFLYKAEYVEYLKYYNSSLLVDLVDFGTKFPKLLVIYIYIYIHIHIYKYTHTHTYIHAHTYMQPYVHQYQNLCLCHS